MSLLETLSEFLDPVVGPDQVPVLSDYDLLAHHDGQLPDGKAAAVLMPLIEREIGWQVLLTLRSSSMPTHAGQISFPGGRSNQDDSGLHATALREFEEETGIDQTRVHLLGRFDPYHTVTNYRITPFLGYVEPPFTISPDPREVADVFEVPFSFLRNLDNFKRESRVWQGRERFFYSIPWQDRYIWGATAGMLRALALRLNQETGTIS
jgi:8-oxo-dGTP pyrophosphatase MutT (NUDIX family)